MSKLESSILGVFIGSMIIIFTFCFGWWTGFAIYEITRLPETIIKTGMIIGISMGLLLNVLFLKKWITHAYDLNHYVWAAAYFVLSIGIIGFFMGVPIFNFITGVLAGVFVGRKSKHMQVGEEKFRSNLKALNILNIITLSIVCIFSAAFALYDPYTAANIQGMLDIRTFQITKAHIIGIIFFGGFGLLGVQHFLTQKCAVTAYKMHEPS